MKSERKYYANGSHFPDRRDEQTPEHHALFLAVHRHCTDERFDIKHSTDREKASLLIETLGNLDVIVEGKPLRAAETPLLIAVALELVHRAAQPRERP